MWLLDLSPQAKLGGIAFILSKMMGLLAVAASIVSLPLAIGLGFAWGFFILAAISCCIHWYIATKNDREYLLYQKLKERYREHNDTTNQSSLAS